MTKSGYFKIWLLGTAGACAFIGSSFATNFDVPGGSLEAALNAYAVQSGVQLMIPADSIGGIHSRGAKGDLSAPDALSRILSGTGFTARRDSSGVVGIVPEAHSQLDVTPIQMAQAAPPRASVETVTVTSSKLGGADVQSIPIAITALSQEQLTATQTAGGPDLVKQVPNLTFTKTNFTGYSINIRGIGTQAISVTTDPAVAVAFNDVPFIRNHFFEQEFYDVSQVEVLRGPQGTLYGRNATAGVVNLISAKPTDQFEAMASGDIGNYKNRRFEGMINLPIVDDRFDLRVAGEWTKRNGYSTNEITGNPIDGRDLWSARLSLSYKPTESVHANFVWEHFSEDDDRMRTAKQLCKTDTPPSELNGQPISAGQSGLEGAIIFGRQFLSQGCLPASLYSPENFQTPYGFSLPYVVAGGLTGYLDTNVDPYARPDQSHDLRVIESTIDPRYKAKNDTVELSIDYIVAPGLTLTSQTGGNQDFLWSTEDYNRFNTSPGLIKTPANSTNARQIIDANGNFCDPQLGCTSRLVAQDLSDETSWQFSQEFRLSSQFEGPLNFSFGGNLMHYETEENYYVFVNLLSLYSAVEGHAHGIYVPGVSDSRNCLPQGTLGGSSGWAYPDPYGGGGQPTSSCVYMDPNPIGHLNNKGHNYFLSQNPYVLNSDALFGEVYYDVAKDLKLTGGLRWTDDRKHFTDIPSEVITAGYGYPIIGTINQSWSEFTGRAAINWTPKLKFSDQTLIYGSYAHGYKAGGANPPGAAFPTISGAETSGTASSGEVSLAVHPLTFEPEFINAFELGTKNTLADGAVTFNGNVFFYDYKGYQISQIVDRTSINLNFDATVKGAELETSWEPFPGLRFKFAGGYEQTRIDDGQQAVDLIDRTAGTPGWTVVKPFPTQASNCILPTYVVEALLYQQAHTGASFESEQAPSFACTHAYGAHLDPVTQLQYTANPTATVFADPNVLPIQLGYVGFNPDGNPQANGGEGFAKNLGGNELPNAPRFTTSLSAEYSIPLTEDWAGTLHGDFYWQAAQWARVFNDDPYDRIHGFTNVNLALVLTSQAGWQVMGYVKNVFDTTAITGTFLNSDDSGLTTNVFLTDPRLFGVRVTKNW
jgi:outer membrane receptor protein involved in Fe transport